MKKKAVGLRTLVCRHRLSQAAATTLMLVPFVALSQAQQTAPAAGATATAASQPQENKSGKGQQELQQVGEGVMQRIRDFSDGKPESIKGLAGDAITIIKYIVESTRADQASVYTFVRAVNRHLDSVECLASEAADCAAFVDRVRKINEELLAESYTDTLFQNANLSNQLKVRLPLLIEDSLKLTAQHTPERRRDFEREFGLISRRFLDSRRFRAGFGVTLSYLPDVVYRDRFINDFSPYQTTTSVLNGGDTSQFVFEFSDRSVQSLILNADMPYVQIDALFPTLDATEIDISRAQVFDIDASTTELLARSTITSKLKAEYEISLKLSFPEIAEGIRRKRQKPPAERSLDRHDWGLGLGMSGFEIANDISSDIRFRTDGTTPFNDLPSGETIERTDSTSFNTLFFDAYWTLHITDELNFGIDFRSYRRDTTSDGSVDVHGAQISLTALWHPTWAW
jgi:hypothetical protein